ncbi:MAG: class 3 adenylate cyclase/ligand-binding sensor domain-containing protein [Gammaproteobacteria bacterium]|jgi:class 3 adenylate cyclase/ligand-binding sensor domain-containing protein
MSLIKKSWLFLLLLLIDPLWVFSQSGVDQVQIKIYSFEEGLSHRDVYQLSQDKHGFLWIATANGLNRFDSKNFLHIHQNEVLKKDNITELQYDGDDQLWLSLSNRLAKFDLDELQGTSIKTVGLYPAVLASKESTTFEVEGSFNSLLVDANKRLWACSYDSKSGRSHLQSSREDGTLQSVLSAKGDFEKRGTAIWNERVVFAFDENTLLEVDDNGDVFHRYKLGKGQIWITDLQNCGDSMLWALSNTGQLYTLKKGSTEFKFHDLSRTIQNQSLYQSLSISENGDVWVAGRNALWWYQASTKRVFDFTQNIRDYVKHGVNFRQVFEDQTGVIWVASDFGLIKLTFPNPLFTNYLYDNQELCAEEACSIRGMAEDEAGNIYISYYNSIYRLDPVDNMISPLFPNKAFSNPPFGILHHQNKLWTGNGKCIDLKTQEITSLFDMPLVDLGAVMLDHEKEIWFGYRNRIFIYNTYSNKLRPLSKLAASLGNNLDISFLYQSPNDLTIWIGTLKSGLFRIDKYKGLLAHYDTKGENGIPLLHDKINGIYEDKNKQLWVATGNGLHQLDLVKKEITPYLPKDGLAHPFINGLASEGDSVIWLSTDNGLSRFSIANKNALNFKKEDGLSANEFNRMSCYKAKNGRMYFGGMDGINAFNPGNHFLKNQKRREGKVLLTQFSKLDGNKDSLINIKSGFKSDKAIGISWKDRLFTFQFALANFDNPGAHQFSYKLDGLEENWSSPTSSNMARYNTIPHGDYTFRVRARSGSDNWNNNELAVPIYIQQPFYKTWWFLVLCASSIIGLILFIAQYRLRQARTQQLTLQREVRARTLDLEIAVRKSDELLLNILPADIAEELKTTGKAKARRHEEVTVFFSDFKGFTLIAQQLDPEALVAEIDYCFREFDNIMDRYHLEKIKTIGDAYMCAGGISNDLENSALSVVKAAIDIQAFMVELAERKKQNGEPFFETRIGIHTGPVVSGIVGIKKFAFDIWGDTVNIAARLEDNGEVGKVNISQTTYELVKAEYDCLHRGKISIKNLEEVDMYYVEGRR